MIKTISPVLIIGTQRSGSNLLRIMLHQLKEIEAPHPPHLLQIFFPLLPVYGDLNDKKNFKALIDDVCRYVEVNPVKWAGMDFDRNEIEKRCRKHSLVEIFRVLYERKAEIKGACFWCCKSMANLYFITQIEAENIHPFYIHLIRDGRDVAASFQKAIVGEKHVYFTALQWKREQELCAEILKKHGNERTAILFYEQFIDNPEKSLRPVLEKLGLKWEAGILEFYHSEEAKNTAAAGEMWKNVARPVDNTNKKHYSEMLRPDEVEIFERVAGSVLLQFGYELNYARNETPFSEEEIAGFRLENESMKKQKRESLLKDAMLRMPQEKILEEIKKREIPLLKAGMSK